MIELSIHSIRCFITRSRSIWLFSDSSSLELESESILTIMDRLRFVPVSERTSLLQLQCRDTRFTTGTTCLQESSCLASSISPRITQMLHLITLSSRLHQVSPQFAYLSLSRSYHHHQQHSILRCRDSIDSYPDLCAEPFGTIMDSKFSNVSCSLLATLMFCKILLASASRLVSISNISRFVSYLRGIRMLMFDCYILW